MTRKRKYIVGSIVLVVSYIISLFLIKSVFVADGPEFYPNAFANLKNNFFNSLKDPSYIVKTAAPGKSTQLDDKKNLEVLQKTRKAIEAQKIISAQNFAKGIHAMEEDNVSYVLINDEGVQWKEYTYTIRGKIVKIQVPADQEPPTQERMEQGDAE